VALAWLVPGLGHGLLGRWRRGVAQGLLILGMYAVGLLLDGALSHPREGSYLALLATVADLGVGPLYLVLRALGAGVGDVTAATHEIGNTFHWSAGIMNLLLVLDAFDVSQGRK
jgi:hypothetical protein